MEYFEGGIMPNMVNIIHIFNCPIYSYSNHTHFDQCEIVFVAGGTGVYTICNQAYTVTGGDLLLINRGAVHSVDSSQDDPLDVWTLSINQFTVSGLEVDCVITPGSGPLVKTEEQAPLFKQLFMTLLTQSVDQNPGYTEICRSICGTVCILARQRAREQAPYKKLTAGGPAAENAPSGAADIMAYIDENFARPISLNSLSTLFFMSPGHINHLMAAEYGISPIDYVIRKRINAAQWVLVMKDTPVKDIALDLGYDSIEHFIKQFKKRTGLTPSQYRKKYSGVMVLVKPGSEQGKKAPDAAGLRLAGE